MTTEEIIEDGFTISNGEQEETFKFDSRRKELTRTIITTTKIEKDGHSMGTSRTVTTQVYNEDGIKDIFQHLKRQQMSLGEKFAAINKVLDATKDIEADEELMKFRENYMKMQALKGYDNKVQAQESRDFLLKDSEAIKSQMKTILKVAGAHINLE